MVGQDWSSSGLIASYVGAQIPDKTQTQLYYFFTDTLFLPLLLLGFQLTSSIWLTNIGGSGYSPLPSNVNLSWSNKMVK